MKNVYIIILLFITAFTQAQIVNIPDANFKNALVNTLCVDTDGNSTFDSDADINNDGEIQLSEAQAVLRLNISDNSINSLEGIESFTELVLLYCQYNAIVDLDLSQSSNLQYLRCYNNDLTNLDVTQNPNLEDLYCSSNNLTSLDVTQNVNLEYLTCNNNELTNLDVTQNPSLEILECYGALLTSLDVTQNPNLIWLHCSYNQLTSLDVTQNQNLEQLTCHFNQLTSLDLSQNPNLNSLRCEENRLTNLDVTHNPNIETLWCAENELISLDVSQNFNLRRLWCAANPQLISLNLRNGNNINMFDMLAQDNPNLACILVDDETATYPDCNGTWGWCKDSTTIYSEDCSLGLDYNNFITFSMFPNPTQNVLNIVPSEEVESIKIYSSYGLLVKEISNTTIDVSTLSNGLYFAQVSINGKILTKKFIKS